MQGFETLNLHARRLVFLSLVVLLGALLAPLPGVADSLDMPTDIGATPGDTQSVDKPQRGMTMDQVSSQYGEPSQKLAPVGDPPITRWIYPQFTVTFERQYVIDAVVPRKPPQR